MSIVSTSHIVEADIGRVWALVSDIGGVHHWHPKVKQSPLLSDNSTGPGARRRCEFYDGNSVVEEVVDWVEGESVTLELSDMFMPLQTARVTVRLAQRGPSSTEVSMEMDYSVKYGPIGWLMNSVMMRPMMGKMFAEVLSGLEHHAVTGEAVTQDFQPHAAK